MSSIRRRWTTILLDATLGPFMKQDYLCVRTSGDVTRSRARGWQWTCADGEQGRHPKFHRPITEFEKLAGLPVVQNTSFNENSP